jgi:hypothetical protein
MNEPTSGCTGKDCGRTITGEQYHCPECCELGIPQGMDREELEHLLTVLADAYNREPLEAAAEYDYYRAMEQDEARAYERAMKPDPMAWGTPMQPAGYFCSSCWRTGDETGYHPNSSPPCDPVGVTYRDEYGDWHEPRWS